MAVGDEDPPEPSGIEHRGDADEGETWVRSATLGVDGVRLDPGRSRSPCLLDHILEQRSGDAASPVSGSYPEAPDRPDCPLIDQWNGSRVHQPWCLRSDTDSAPTDREVDGVGNIPRRWLPLHLLFEELGACLAT